MNRCFFARSRLLRGLALMMLAGAVWMPSAALAQTTRHFPQKAERANMEFGRPPLVSIDGKAEHLGRGVRVQDQNNRAVLLGKLVGQKHVVNYMRGARGIITQVWILTPAELQRDQARQLRQSPVLDMNASVLHRN